MDKANNRKDTSLSINSKKVSQVFTNILGMSSLLYILGYVSWAIFAIRNDLGILPVLKEQYLISGVAPIIIILIVLILILYFQIKFENKKVKIFNHHHSIIVLSLLALFGASLARYWFFNDDDLMDVVFYVVLIFILFLNIGYMIFRKGLDKYNYSHLFINSNIVIIIFIILFLYSNTIFHQLPFELGGGKPVPIQLDIEPEKLSQRTIHYLYGKLHDKPGNGDNAILNDSLRKDSLNYILTDTLQLIFSTDEYLILDTGRTNDKSTTIRLRKSIIQNVFRIPSDTKEEKHQ